MECEDFCKFAEESPLLALKICHQNLQRKIERGTLDSGEEAQIRTECEDTLEALRVKSVTRELLFKGFTMPPGMNAWHRQLDVFIRWLPGHEKPVSGKVRDVLANQTDWFMHRDLRVSLRWNEDGFYEMKREDSRAFNMEHAANHWLLSSLPGEVAKVSSAHSLSTNNEGAKADDAVTVPLDSDSSSTSREEYLSSAALKLKAEHSSRQTRSINSSHGGGSDGSEAEWSDEESGAVDTTSDAQVETKRPPVAAVLRASSSGDKKPKIKSYFWTQEMDDALVKAMQENRDDWNAIAAAVGKTREQCRSRWLGYLQMAIQEGTKTGPWANEEVALLRQLVPQYVQRGFVQDTIDWQTIAKRLSRTPRDCTNKWNTLSREGMVKGKFSQREDGVIKRRVAEWQQSHSAVSGGKLGQELWDSLQKELNRPAAAVEERWNRIVKWS